MAHPQSHGTIHSEAKEVIANIVEKCDEEKLSKHLLLPLPKAAERAAVYAGVSYATVKKLQKGGQETKGKRHKQTAALTRKEEKTHFSQCCVCRRLR
jgi:hypothetical protein